MPHQLPTYFDERDREALMALEEISTKQVRRLDDSAANLGNVYVYSINPRPFVWAGGGLGIFTVPGCPQDRIYSEPLRIPVQYPDGQPVSISKIVEAAESGWRIAESLVGYGQQMTNDMRKQGLFVCGAFVTIQNGKKTEKMLASMADAYLRSREGRTARRVEDRIVTETAIKWAIQHGDEREANEIAQDILDKKLPTEAEVVAANNAMNAWCLAQVQEADDFHRKGEPQNIQDLHRWAAERTNNLTRAWMQGSLVMQKCPVCGTPTYPGAAICTNCPAVFNEDIVREHRLKGYEHIWGQPANASVSTPITSVAETPDLAEMTKERLVAYGKAIYDLDIPITTKKEDMIGVIEAARAQATKQ